MLKRLTVKFISLSVLVLTLATASSAPGSSANHQLLCFQGPITNDCASGYYCCDLSGNCTCQP